MTTSTSKDTNNSATDEPKSPRTHIKRLSRTFSRDTTSSTSTWFDGNSALFRATFHEEDPPAHYESSLCTGGFVFKIVEWILCILCTGLFFEGSNLIYDFKEQLFPYIAYWTYMMITGVIIISYLLGQKMREILIRVYNIIGGIMFFIAATIIFIVVANKWEEWNDSTFHVNHSNDTAIMSSNNNTGKAPMKKNIAVHHYPPKLARMLLTQSTLCFLNSILYFADTFYSLYVSYKYIKNSLHVNQTKWLWNVGYSHYF